MRCSTNSEDGTLRLGDTIEASGSDTLSAVEAELSPPRAGRRHRPAPGTRTARSLVILLRRSDVQRDWQDPHRLGVSRVPAAPAGDDAPARIPRGRPGALWSNNRMKWISRARAARAFLAAGALATAIAAAGCGSKPVATIDGLPVSQEEFNGRCIDYVMPQNSGGQSVGVAVLGNLITLKILESQLRKINKLPERRRREPPVGNREEAVRLYAAADSIERAPPPGTLRSGVQARPARYAPR